MGVDSIFYYKKANCSEFVKHHYRKHKILLQVFFTALKVVDYLLSVNSYSLNILIANPINFTDWYIKVLK